MVINVYKEPNMTSRDVVNILSNKFNTKKIGHTGTLDPLASGVLLICTDKDTKLVELLTFKDKEYIATIKLGIKTDTGDITGNIIAEKSFNFSKEELVKTLNSFLGYSIQEVPIYSAIKVNGKKLYEYARKNEKVDLPKRTIHISQIQLLEYHNDQIKLQVTVSKGTYIRSLINDICKKLNTVGTMQDLVRTKQGNFNIKDSYKIKEIQEDNYEQVSYKTLFQNYPYYHLNDEEYFKVNNGTKLKLALTDPLIIMAYKNEEIAIYQKDDDIYRMYKKLK